MKLALGLGSFSVVFFMFLNHCFPERETVIDWQEGTIRRRKGWRWRTYALSDLSKIRVTEDRLNDNLTTALLQLIVEGEPLTLLSSNGYAGFDEACGVVVVAVERLAEACGVSFELPEQIDRQRLATVSARELAEEYAQAGSYCVEQMHLAVENSAPMIVSPDCRLIDEDD